MLIVYHGSDSYRLRGAVNALIAVRKTANIFSVDCTDDDAAEQLERPLKYTTFFDEHKLIIAKHGACDAVADVVKRYGVAKAKDVTLAVVQDTNGKYDKKALANLTKIADRVESLEPLKGAALAAWVREYCGQRNASIEPVALAALLQRTNGELWALANELEKLCAYAHDSAIDVKAVQALVPPRYDQDEWELSNALAAVDKRAAITALWRRLQEGTSEQMLLGSLAAGIRNVSMVKDMQDRHQPAAAVAKLTGLHPFVISKTARGAAKADSALLRRAHLRLAQLDRAAKNGLADTVDGMFSILMGL
jgi:DNA polymerase III delta subunit